MSLTLRLKTKNGQHIVNKLTKDSSLEELKCAISDLTKIPANSLKILSGYPPKPMDVSHNDKTLSSLEIRSGETLIVEEDSSHKAEEEEKLTVNLLREMESQMKATNGMLMRKVVPANNSCLFTSVNFVTNGGKLELESAQRMREIIARTVRSDPETFHNAFLGCPNTEYCTWIMDDNTWGGGIEAAILSKHYQKEIAVVDTQSARINLFGEDQHYSERVLLIYDGIHYDPLYMEYLDSGKIETIFSCSNDVVLAKALDLAKEAQSSRQFTDTTNFTLRCLVCQKALSGQVEAQKHAKDTGHANFSEV